MTQDEYDKLRKSLITPAGSGIKPNAGTTPVPPTTGTGILDKWLQNQFKVAPSGNRWEDVNKPVINTSDLAKGAKFAATGLVPVLGPAYVANQVAGKLMGQPQSQPVSNQPQTQPQPVNNPVSINPKVPLQSSGGGSPLRSISNQGFTTYYRPEPAAQNENNLTRVAPWSEHIPTLPGSNINAYNPNDKMFSDLASQIMETANTGTASVERATKLKNMRNILEKIVPMTSYGQYGMSNISAETARRGQDITALTENQRATLGARGQDVTMRGQDLDTMAKDVVAKLTKDRDTADALYKAGVLKQGQEKLDIERILANQKDPKAYLDAIDKLSPEITEITEKGEIKKKDINAGKELVNKIFNMESPNEAPPKDGDEKTFTVKGKQVTVVFKNGQWVKKG